MFNLEVSKAKGINFHVDNVNPNDGRMVAIVISQWKGIYLIHDDATPENVAMALYKCYENDTLDLGYENPSEYLHDIKISMNVPGTVAVLDELSELFDCDFLDNWRK